MTEIEKIKARLEEGSVVLLTSFLNVFMIRIGALISPAIIFGIMYTEWNGKLEGIQIFLLIMLAISVLWSLYFLLTTGSAMLKGQTLIIKKNFRKTRKLNIKELEGVSEEFVKRTFSSSGNRFSKIYYPKENGKSTFLLITEGRTTRAELSPSVGEILSLALSLSDES